MVRGEFEIPVKSWYIEVTRDGQRVNREVVISTSQIFPGMEPIYEVLEVRNRGDADAEISYAIEKARIFGNPENEYIVGEGLSSETVEDILAHEFPFKINISLSKNYSLAESNEITTFNVSISWPLDSGDNELDSKWGREAFAFNEAEQDRRNNDPTYVMRPPIHLSITLSAEQFLETDNSPDPNFNLGDIIIYDPVSNTRCESLGPDCFTTFVIDTNNTLGDNHVTLLPNPVSSHTTSSFTNLITTLNNTVSTWTVSTRPLEATDIMKVISKDIYESVLVRNDLSDAIIGNMTYGNRINEQLNKATEANGLFRFSSQTFSYLSSQQCFWTNTSYNSTRAFAVQRTDNETTRLFGETRTTSCKVIPVILAPKSRL